MHHPALGSIQIKITDPRIGDEFPMPSYATAGSAGIDLVACIKERLVIQSGDLATLIDSGLSIHVSDPNYAAMILPRSGMGHKKGLVLGNTIGLIDSDYTGKLMISAWNRNASATIMIEPGERIAQLIFVPICRPKFEFVSEFSAATERGEGGFGSTGSK